MMMWTPAEGSRKQKPLVRQWALGGTKGAAVLHPPSSLPGSTGGAGLGLGAAGGIHSEAGEARRWSHSGTKSSKIIETERGSVDLEGLACDFPEAVGFPFKLAGSHQTCRRSTGK